MLTLSLWQISVIAVMAVIAILIGTLVAYARALTNRAGKAYAALRRIEEGLISASAPRGHAGGLVASMAAADSAHGAPGPDSRGRESRIRQMPMHEAHREMPVSDPRGELAIPEMLLAEGAVHEMSAAAMSAAGISDMDVPVPERDRRVSYLTVRDLKVMARSGRRRSDTEVSQEAAAQLSARLFSGAQKDGASGDRRLHASQPGAIQPGLSQAGVDQADARQAGAGQAGADQDWTTHADAVQADAGQADSGPEPTGLSSSSAVLQELATATSEVRALLNESAEPTGGPIAAVVAPDEAVAEAHEEVYAYSELVIAPAHRAAPDAVLPPMDEPLPDAARELAPTEAAKAANEPAPTQAANAPAPTEAASEPAPTETSIQTPAPVAELSSLTTSVEDQPAPQVSSDTDAELAEKRRKRNAELILAAHHRRRRARGH